MLVTTNLSLIWFLISCWFWFLGWRFLFFKAMNRFITTPKVFSRYFQLKNMFLDKKKLKPNFLVTIVAGIWASLDDASFNFFLKFFFGWVTCHCPKCIKKKRKQSRLGLQYYNFYFTYNFLTMKTCWKNPCI